MNVGLSGAVWRRSTLSTTNACVEVAVVGDRIAVRDSKGAGGPVLEFTPVERDAFLGGVRTGEFDLPQQGPRLPRRQPLTSHIALWTALLGLAREVVELWNSVLN
jgi:hypothetical protein